jgi:DHA2 family multidrug resistance protein
VSNKEQAVPKKATNKWIIALAVSFGTLMGAIDSSIVNVALSHIRGSVGASLTEITWISTSFALSTVLVMPLVGFLGRLFGQKRVYMFCLFLFILGSALCGLARSLISLSLFRALQGFGAGGLQPSEQAILRQTFPPKEQGTAMALFSLAVMVGPAVGPTLGGYITDNFSWPWIFYINLPVGILGLFMVWRFVDEPQDIQDANRAAAARQRKNMDWSGIVLLSMFLMAIQYTLEEGQAEGWFDSWLIIITSLSAAFLLVAFVIRELTAPVPVVNLSLFKDEVFLSGSIIGALMFAMLMGSMFLLPVFMQELLGFDATQSGMTLMPRTLIMMVAVPIVGRLYNKVPARVLIAFGVVLFAFGCYLLSHITLQTTSSGIVSALLVTGAAFACLFVPLNTTALANIPRPLLADATGLNSLFRQFGGSIGLAIFANLLTKYSAEGQSSVASHLVVTRPEVISHMAGIQGGMMAKGFDAVSAEHLSYQLTQYSIMGQGTVLAFEKLFLLQGIAFLAVLPLLFFLKTKRVNPGRKVEIHAE